MYYLLGYGHLTTKVFDERGFNVVKLADLNVFRYSTIILPDSVGVARICDIVVGLVSGVAFYHTRFIIMTF